MGTEVYKDEITQDGFYSRALYSLSSSQSLYNIDPAFRPTLTQLSTINININIILNVKLQ